MMLLLKVALCIIGIGFMVLAFFDALRLVRNESRSEEPIKGATDPESWADLVRAAVDLIKVSPRWLLLFLVGIALVVVAIVI
jgi:hypothetical protein